MGTMNTNFNRKQQGETRTTIWEWMNATLS